MGSVGDFAEFSRQNTSDEVGCVRSVSSVQGRVYYTESRVKGAGARMATPLLYSPAYIPGDGALWGSAACPARAGGGTSHVGGAESAGGSAHAAGGGRRGGDERDGKRSRGGEHTLGGAEQRVPKLELPIPGSGVHYYVSPEGVGADEQRGGDRASACVSAREGKGGGGAQTTAALSGRTMLGHAEGVDRNRGMVAKKDVIREYARCW